MLDIARLATCCAIWPQRSLALGTVVCFIFIRQWAPLQLVMLHLAHRNVDECDADRIASYMAHQRVAVVIVNQSL